MLSNDAELSFSLTGGLKEDAPVSPLPKTVYIATDTHELGICFDSAGWQWQKVPLGIVYLTQEQVDNYVPGSLPEGQLVMNITNGRMGTILNGALLIDTGKNYIQSGTLDLKVPTGSYYTNSTSSFPVSEGQSITIGGTAGLFRQTANLPTVSRLYLSGGGTTINVPWSYGSSTGLNTRNINMSFPLSELPAGNYRLVLSASADSGFRQNKTEELVVCTVTYFEKTAG